MLRKLEIDDVIGGYSMETNPKMKGISELMKIIETWHHYCAFRKTQDEAYCDVAMATILAPVSFCSEPNYHFLVL